MHESWQTATREQLLESLEWMSAINKATEERYLLYLKENAELKEKLAEAQDKAILYDLDQAGIQQREKDAIELVELRYESLSLKKKVRSLANQLAEYLDLTKVDGEVYNLGRAEGASDVAAMLRSILDPSDEQKLNLDGLLNLVSCYKMLSEKC
jgi:hypothetical protein